MADLETKVSVIETKVDAFIHEMRDFKTEMRDRDNQRAAEIRELRADMKVIQQKHDADMKAIQQKHDADMKQIRKEMQAAQSASDKKFDKIEERLNRLETKIDSAGKEARSLVVTSILGIGAIAAAVIGFIYAVAPKIAGG